MASGVYWSTWQAGDGTLSVTRDGLVFQAGGLLVDCWYMGGWLIQRVLAIGLDVVGQVRTGTVLFEVPVPAGQRAKQCKYGEQIDFSRQPE